MTTNIRSDDPAGWTKVPHTLARDPRLSNGARGLAVQMLSHADGYRSDEQFLAQHTAEGRDAVRRQLAELRRYGYLVRERVRGADGKVTTRSVLYDVPRQTELPTDPPPTRGKPATRSDQGRFTKPQVEPSRGDAATRPDQGKQHADSAGKGDSPHAGNPRDGSTSTNTTNPQVTPTRGMSASRSDQAEHSIAAGHADSRETRALIEDQGEDQKKISQSGEVHENRAPVTSGQDGLTDPPSRAHTQATERTARRNQCRRELHQAYGLNDTEADQAMAVCDLRSTTPIRSYVAYLRGMDANDRADIIEAIQLGDRRRQLADAVTDPEPEPAPEPPVTPRMDATGCMDAPPPADPATIAAEAAAEREKARTRMEQLRNRTTAARLEPEPSATPTSAPTCPDCGVLLDPGGTCFVCQPEPTRIPARTA